MTKINSTLPKCHVNRLMKTITKQIKIQKAKIHKTKTSFKKVGVKILFNNDAVTKIKVKHIFIQPPSQNLCNH